MKEFFGGKSGVDKLSVIIAITTAAITGIYYATKFYKENVALKKQIEDLKIANATLTR